MFDCIIVGAGPAGATAAYHLAKSGKSVLLLELASFPRNKTCGGGVSPAIAKYFDFDFSPIIDNTVNKVQFSWKLGDPVIANLSMIEPMWMVKRDAFDQFLVQQAQKQGAEFKDNTQVTTVKFNGSNWEVSTSNGAFQSRYLIAADGANGRLATMLGLDTGEKSLGATLFVKTPISPEKKNTAYFDFGLLKNGSIWNFPNSEGYTISGAFFRGNKGNSEELKKQLTEYATQFGLNLANSTYSEHPINFWKDNQTLHANNALLASEAAGIVDPLTGEGIRPSIFTGFKAAEAIQKALAGDKAALEKYTLAIKEEWGADMNLAHKLSGLFYQFPQIAYKVGVKRPAAAQLVAKILVGELSYKDIADKATQRLKKSLTFGLG